MFPRLSWMGVGILGFFVFAFRGTTASIDPCFGNPYIFGRGDFIIYNYLDHAAKGLTILATVNRVYDFCMYVLYSCHSRRKVFTFHMCIYDSMERWMRQLPFNLYNNVFGFHLHEGVAQG